ncbi:class I SAM-dependent methyltransferase [Synechococcus sp. BSF8S]|uniref:class I SAM-dependent methyltransferase n=1 Tax=Synechococcales TaxID=1890424 RepID=UPI001624E660|nr:MULTISPECIES: class I SAM-dependent methyltransferase [unclassified Synechococcus]MBC1261869.1 class I SAM-dependent methyltransferase [Synechococcus sp. BSF8S]MBC1264796.1 class I SAM-dependent methyltransferase [Synechococcus sp. BSA11S]
MDLFEHQWSTYRRVVDADLMEHQALSAATSTAIEGWLAERPEGQPPPRMVDLGCGDLALLASLLRRLPLGSYLGLDCCAPVLPRAAAQLKDVPYPCSWRAQDLLSWALDPGANGSGPVDLLHSSFAVHHLSDEQKGQFLSGAHSQLAPGGMLLWADVFRESGESRDSYLQRYVQRIRRGWQALSAEESQQVIDHLSSFDHPADAAAIQRTAEACGWDWQWLWRGQHRAEALARLTPR